MRRIRWRMMTQVEHEHVAHVREGKSTCMVFDAKHERKRPLRIPRPRSEDNIKVDFQD